MRSYRQMWKVLLAAAIFLGVGSEAFAQGGIVQGRVTNSDNREPIVGAQVSIPGTQRGTVTDREGIYRITGVPTGAREVRAEIIGFGSVNRTVTVVADQVVTADFELKLTVLNLEEIIVTGVAGQSTRAKIPFSVERLTTSAMPVPASNAGAMLQGKAAGVAVASPTGRPGTAPSVLLRGPTSINASGRSQEPLWIVDGVILAESVADIDAMDIESIEIVKGAAAASLYGSRAANGVIQITTNRGQNVANDQVRYTLRTDYGASQLPGRFNLTQKHHFAMNDEGLFIASTGAACEWLKCPSLALAGQRRVGTQTASAWNTIQQESWPGVTYDHVDRFFRGGDYMQNYFSVAGRSGGTNYLISYNRLAEEGIMPGADGLVRHGFRINVDQSVRNDITVSASAAYTRSVSDPREGTMFALTRMPAGVDLLAADPNYPTQTSGEKQIVLKPDPFNDNQNPLTAMLYQDSERTRGRYLASVSTNWRPLEWFRLDGNVSFDRLDHFDETFSPKGYRTLSNPTGTGGSLSRRNDLTESVNASLTASFIRSFGDLNTSSSVRYLIEREDWTTTTTSGTEFTADQVWTFSNIPNANISGTSSIQLNRADGFFVSTDLDFRDRYVLGVLVRQDGQSRFGPDSRRRWYYRVSGAYRVSEEPWFSIPQLDELKIRYSVGTAGSTPNFAAQYETFSVGAGSISPVALGNRNLRPEYSTEHELGLEAQLFGRVSTELNYARSRVEDQILNVPLPAIRGFARQWQNAGTLESNTIEATIGAQILRGRNLTWNSRLMFDRTRQEITELNVPAYRDGVDGQGLGNVFYVRQGEAIGTFYGFQFAEHCGHLPAGVDCSQFEVNDDGYLVWIGGAGNSRNGWQTYTDASGNTQNWWGTTAPFSIRGVALTWGTPFQAEDIDPISGERATFLPLGNTQPDFRLGLSNTVSWRSFSVYGLVESVQGFKVYNQPLQWATFQNYSGIMDQSGIADENQRKPIGYYQRLYGASGLQASSAFIHDASFTKLRELSVRYRASRSVLDRMPFMRGFEGVTFSVTGNNLITWSSYDGYDPDVGSTGGGTGSAAIARVDGYSYPPFRTVKFGLELNF